MSEKRKISEISSAEPFYGERKCSNVKDGKKCTFGAYWAKQVGRTTHYVCGVHSKDGTRKKLKRDPDAKTKREAELEAALELAKKEAAERKARGVRGSATCQKMRMMSLVECQPGHRNVFPNYRHEKRVDGVGCASLSPMNLGPIEHNEKDVPVAATLENYHQV